MNAEDRKAQFRAYYYRHHEENMEKARVRSAQARAARQETPEQAEERRQKNREWYARKAEEQRAHRRAYQAERRGDEPLPDVGSMDPKRRHEFLTLLIALLCKRRNEHLAKRREWKHQRFGTKTRQPRKPKVIKPKRPLMTLEEKRAKRAAFARKWRARQTGRAVRPPRVPKPPKPPKPVKVPETLEALRAKRLSYAKRWLAKMKATDPDRYVAYMKRQTEKELTRRRTSPQKRFACILRTKVYVAICRQQAGKKTANTVTLTGCSIKELMVHIEKQFQPGMTWENLGKGSGFWNVDHVRPLASWDLTVEANQREAFHFSNLSPKWSLENISKGSEWQGRRWLHNDHACVPPTQAPPSCSDKV